MRHSRSGRQLGRPTGQRQALFRNLVSDLLRYEKITTTEAKAREVKALTDKVITLGKQGTLHARRQALSFIYDEAVVAKVFDQLAPRYANRPGGYTRLVKLGPRTGDGAPTARLELV